MTLATPKRWSRSEYYRLAELDFFQNERVELLEGEIVEMSPQNRPHAAAIGRLNTLLVRSFGDTHIVRVQLPLDIDEHNQPEPDFAVVPIPLVEDSDPHPPTADWIIEVADSSLALDRQRKSELYARAGVPVYWVVNVRESEIEVFSELRDGKYRTRRVFTGNDSVSFPENSGETRPADLS